MREDVTKEVMALKAAAYGLAAKLGPQQAANELRGLAAELVNDAWNGPGNQ